MRANSTGEDMRGYKLQVTNLPNGCVNGLLAIQIYGWKLLYSII